MIAACLMSLSLFSTPVGTWVRNASTIGAMQWVTTDPGHAGRVYAANSGLTTVFQSNDSGASWTTLPRLPNTLGTPNGIIAMVVSPAGNLFVVDGNNHVLYIWNGISWNALNVGHPFFTIASTTVGVFAISYAHIREIRDDGSIGAVYSANAYAAGSSLGALNGQLLAMIPNDGLATFSTQNANPVISGGISLGGALSLLVDAASQTEYVFDNGTGSLYERRSGDADFAALALAPVHNTNGLAHIGTDGTVYVLASSYAGDSGKNDILRLSGTYAAPTWTIVGSSSTTGTVAINDFAVNADGSIVLATDAGIENLKGSSDPLTDTLIVSGPFVGPQVAGSFYPDPRTFPESMLLYDGANEWESADGFAPLTKKGETPISPAWLAQDPVTHIGYAYDGVNHYYSGGPTWVTETAPNYAGYASTGNQALVDNGSNLYVYGDGGSGIYRSHRNTDGSCVLTTAICWTQISTQNTTAMGIDGSTLYAAVGPTLLTSTDAGATWKTMVAPLPTTPIITIVIDPSTHRPWVLAGNQVYALNGSSTAWAYKNLTGGQIFLDKGTSPTTIYVQNSATTIVALHDTLAAYEIGLPGSAQLLYFNAATRVFYAEINNAAYAYALPTSPTISGIDVKTGPTAGGTAVKVSGSNFVEGETQVFFGAQNAPGKVVSSTEIDVTSPANVAGAVDVTVANGTAQQATLAGAFTYTAPAALAAPVAATAPVASTNSVGVIKDSGCSASGTNVWALPVLLAFGVWRSRRSLRGKNRMVSRASSHATISSKGNGMTMKGLLVGALLALTACHGKQYFFTGRVYDGVTRQPITAYKIQLQYGQSTVNGTVNKDGTYYLGALPPLTDFSVAINATGYRTFLSVNSSNAFTEQGNCGTVDDCTSQPETQYWDAYVFPTALQTPAMTINFFETDSQSLPTGTLRLVPNANVGTPASGLETQETEAAPINQWNNDADAQFGTVTAPITNGVAQLAAGALVYGADYNMDIFGITGYQVSINNNDFVAGEAGDIFVSLDPLQSTGNIEQVYISTNNPAPAGSATLTIVFNEPIALSPAHTKASYIDDLNSNFTFASPDLNKDGTQNTPVVPVAGAGLNEFGIDIEVTGNALTITASLPASAFATKDAGTPPDPINTVTFGNLADISIVSTANPNSSRTLNQLGVPGSETVTVTATTVP